MDKLLRFLEANPWLNLVFLALAVVSILVSVIAYLKSKREKVPLCKVYTFSLLDPAVATIEGLLVSHDGKEVSKLALTKAALWNQGKETIRDIDLAEGDRLRVQLPDGAKILATRITYPSVGPNQFSVHADGSSVYIRFDFMDCLQGLALDIYHTGDPSEPCEWRGTIIGGRDLADGTPRDDVYFDRFSNFFFGWLPLPKHRTLRQYISAIYAVLFLPVFLPIGLVLLVVGKIQCAANPVPKEFLLMASAKS